MRDAFAIRRLAGPALIAVITLAPLVGAQPAGAAPIPVAEQQLISRQLDARLTEQVQAVLDRVAGAGHAIAQISADLDFSQTSSSSQLYVHDKSTPPLAAGADRKSYRGLSESGSYASATVDNALGVVSRTMQNAPGRVVRISIAVVLDRARTSSSTVRSVSALIKAAVGFSAKRGDTLSIQPMALAPRAVRSAAVATGPAPWRRNIVLVAGVGLMALLAVGFALVGRRRRS